MGDKRQMKLSGELDYRIRYDVEHDLFHAQNVFNDEYIKPTFIEYVQKLEKENAELRETLKTYNGCGDWDNDFHTCRVYLQHEELQMYINQLTKAKRVIQSFVWWHTGEDRGSIDSNDLVERARQLLREIDIDNAIQKANEGLDLDKIAEEVEDDLKEGCPNVLCEGCTEEDCTAKKLGLIC